MKRTVTFLSFFTFLLFLQNKAFAQTYPVYLCGSTATVTLKPGIPISAGDEVVWVKVTGGTTQTVQSSATNINYTTPTGLATGEHTYRVHIISKSPDFCEGDASDDYSIYQLPAFAVTLSSPTNYCENATATSITATASATEALPAGVSFNYTWVAKKGATTLTIGDVGDNSANQNILNMTTTTVGDYILTATSSYVIPTGSTLKDDGSCDVTSAPETIKVLPKPSKPTITIL